MDCFQLPQSESLPLLQYSIFARRMPTQNMADHITTTVVDPNRAASPTTPAAAVRPGAVPALNAATHAFTWSWTSSEEYYGMPDQINVEQYNQTFDQTMDGYVHPALSGRHRVNQMAKDALEVTKGLTNAPLSQNPSDLPDEERLTDQSAGSARQSPAVIIDGARGNLFSCVLAQLLSFRTSNMIEQERHTPSGPERTVLPIFEGTESEHSSIPAKQYAGVVTLDGVGEAVHRRAQMSSKTGAEVERRKGVPWTPEEHRQFWLGIEEFGKGRWKEISQKYITSRTPTQIASHAQKYYIRLNRNKSRYRRISVLDITCSVDERGGDALNGGQGPISGQSSVPTEINTREVDDDVGPALITGQSFLSSTSRDNQHECRGSSQGGPALIL